MANQQNQAGTDEKDPYTLDKETADGYIQSWVTGPYSIIPSTIHVNPGSNQLELDSFVFSFNDFLDFAGRVNSYNTTNPQNPITGVACKIGIKPSPFADGKRPNVPCLIFEALSGFTTPGAFTKQFKKDVIAGTDVGDINNENYQTQSTAPVVPPQGASVTDLAAERTGAEIGSMVTGFSDRYDFSYPCPPTCPGT